RNLHDPAGNGVHHDQANLLEGERRLLEEGAEHIFRLAAGTGRSLGPLVDRGGDDIPRNEWAPEQRPPEELGRAAEPDILLGGRDADPAGWLDVGLSDFDVVAHADVRVCALQSVEADQIETFVFRVRGQGCSSRRPLTGDLYDVSLVEAQ